jgi:hypothetical protein
MLGGSGSSSFSLATLRRTDSMISLTADRSRSSRASVRVPANSDLTRPPPPQYWPFRKKYGPALAFTEEIYLGGKRSKMLGGSGSSSFSLATLRRTDSMISLI